MVHTQNITPVFDPKYRTVLYIPDGDRDYTKINWINDNTSNRAVDIKFENHGIYMAFEDENDALIFKIKFL